MRAALPVLITLLISSPVLAKEPACQSPFVFETNPVLRLWDMAHFAVAETFGDPDGNQHLTVEQYDEEDYPNRGPLMGVGIVYATTGDLGEPGLGGRLWSKVVVDLDTDQMKALDKTNGGVNVIFVARKSLGACGRPSFKIRFDRSGNVSANGRKIGKMQ